MANTTHLAAESTEALAPGDAGWDALDDLWGRLARPFDVAATVGALVGLPAKEIAQLVGAVIATSPEAELLLDELPHSIRSLATSMQTQAERCVGELRGPVLWSETLAARASSFGNPDVFVCAAPSRAYDIDENRVLVWALVLVRDAAERATVDVDVRHQDVLMRRAKLNGNDAGRFVEHPALARVSRVRPSPRAIRRTRAGKKKRSYLPALQMIDKATNPVDAGFVRDLCDERTRVQHQVLMQLVHRLERHGGRLPEFRVERGAVYAGPVQYYHGRRRGDRSQLSGIVIGQLLVDVPDQLHDPSRDRAEASLAARSGNRRTMVIMDDDDIDRAIDRAIDLARSA
ncbi:MAG: hypothetical protein KDB33_04585 [Acidimicrobiales bacterium]|nr:hypothetical protein [Acidimicrobiales bacterium]MCB1259656.1 hypothetical protein [Acidimicrobiales bacterium]